MSAYADSSALLKRYVEERDSAECEKILLSESDWVTARHTWVEVLRGIALLLSGQERLHMEAAFRQDWKKLHIVELDAETCERAADVAKAHGARTLDALHLAAALRVGGPGFRFLTYDVRQAKAGRAVGLTIVGA
jgi:hypothetical protein